MRRTSIPKLLTANFFWIVWTVCLVSFGFSFFFGWGLMVATLYIFFWLFRWMGWEAKLSSRQRWVYLMTVLLYPVAETTVLWLKMHGFFPPDFDLVNRFEHSCWAIALSMMFLPFISGVWKQLNPWQNLIFIVGFVCLLGNFNEFLEYFVRTQHPPFNDALFANFYIDTIYDMMMNLTGSLISFAILRYGELGMGSRE
jgi:hypothetical protein